MSIEGWNPDPDMSGTFDEDRRAADHPGPVLPDDAEVPQPVEDDRLT